MCIKLCPRISPGIQSISVIIVLMVSGAHAFVIKGNILPEGELESLKYDVWRV